MKFRCYQVIKTPNEPVKIHFDTQGGSRLILNLSHDHGYRVGEHYEVPMEQEPKPAKTAPNEAELQVPVA